MSIRERLKWLVENYSGIVGLAGLLIYVMVRVGYEAFYGELGATPEEAGLTYIIIVARAALGLFAYVVIFLLLLWMYVLLSRARSRARRQNDSQASTSTLDSVFELGGVSRTPLLVVTAVVVLLLFFFGNLRLLREGLFQAAPVLQNLTIGQMLSQVTFVVVVLLVTSYFLRQQQRAYQDQPHKVDDALAVTLSGIVLLLIALLALLVIGLLGVSKAWGVYRANEVRQGITVRPSALFGILDIRAVPVCVTQISDDKPILASRRPVMYLGRSSEMILVFDVEQKRIRRIPAEGLQIANLNSGICPTRSPSPGTIQPPTTTTIVEPPTTTTIVEPPTTTTIVEPPTTTTIVEPPTTAGSRRTSEPPKAPPDNGSNGNGTGRGGPDHTGDGELPYTGSPHFSTVVIVSLLVICFGAYLLAGVRRPHR